LVGWVWVEAALAFAVSAVVWPLFVGGVNVTVRVPLVGSLDTLASPPGLPAALVPEPLAPGSVPCWPEPVPPAGGAELPPGEEPVAVGVVVPVEESVAPAGADGVVLAGAVPPVDASLPVVGA